MYVLLSKVDLGYYIEEVFSDQESAEKRKSQMEEEELGYFLSTLSPGDPVPEWFLTREVYHIEEWEVSCARLLP